MDARRTTNDERNEGVSRAVWRTTVRGLITALVGTLVCMLISWLVRAPPRITRWQRRLPSGQITIVSPYQRKERTDMTPRRTRSELGRANYRLSISRCDSF